MLVGNSGDRMKKMRFCCCFELTKETSQKAYHFSIVLIEDLDASEVKAAVVPGHFQAADRIESIFRSLDNMKPARGEALLTLGIDDLLYKVHVGGHCGSLAVKDYRLRVKIWVKEEDPVPPA